MRCTFCDKLGHRVENCFAKQEKEKHRGPVAVRPVGVARPVGLVAVEKPGKWKSPQRAERARGTHKTDLYRPIPPRSGNSHPVRGTHRSFITDGFVSVGTDRRPVKVFRDTGSDQTILRAGVLGSMPYKESVVIKDVWCEQTAVPLVRVVVESKLRSGPVKAAILEKLPYSGVDLVVGNDFCGKRVYPNPHQSRKFVPYPKRPRRTWPGNCRVVATGLPRDLSVEELRTYVKEMVNDEKVHVRRLYRGKSAAFLIRTSGHHWKSLTSLNNWGEGINIKRYYPPQPPRNFLFGN